MDIQTERAKFIEKLKNPSQLDIDKMSYQYSLFTANIKRFLPDYPRKEYKDFFINLMYQKWASIMEQYDEDLFMRSRIINDSSFNLNDPQSCPPLIFAAFHIGPYRLFNSYLIRKGFKIALIVDHIVFISQMEEIKKISSSLSNSDNNFVVLDVKDRASLFRLKDLMLQGYVMSVYVDGNSGLDYKPNEFDNSYSAIKFLNNTIYAKNGIAKLSLLVKANIVPVITYRDNNENPIIHFYKEIEPSINKDKNEYTNQTIKHIYGIFETNLLKYKTQWLDWVQLHKWIKRNWRTNYVDCNDIKYNFNIDRYSLFTHNKSYYLFDLYDYLSYEISFELYNLLSNNQIDKIDNKTIEKLVKINVIE